MPESRSGAVIVRANKEGRLTSKTLVWVIKPGETFGNGSRPVVECLPTGQYYCLQPDKTLEEVESEVRREIRSEFSISEKQELFLV